MEAMIGDLARISGVSVTSRTSVMRYKETTKTTREIARELGVDGVVEASFTRAGNQVVITATLIDGKTDRRMWSQRYEREMQDVLAMQSQVARAISKEISATLTPEAQKYLDEARTVDPAAHDAYLRGRYELNRYTESSLRAAIRHFQEAIDKDPRSARAYAGLADAYSMLRGTYAPPDTVMPKAKDTLSRRWSSMVRSRKRARPWAASRCTTTGTGEPLNRSSSGRSCWIPTSPAPIKDTRCSWRSWDVVTTPRRRSSGRYGSIRCRPPCEAMPPGCSTSVGGTSSSSIRGKRPSSSTQTTGLPTRCSVWGTKSWDSTMTRGRRC